MNAQKNSRSHTPAHMKAPAPRRSRKAALVVAAALVASLGGAGALFAASPAAVAQTVEARVAAQRLGDDIRPVTLMGESEALDKAIEAFGLYGFDGYTYTIDTSRGYECYDFAIEAYGSTYLVTINGYTGFVEGEGTVLRPGDDVRAVTLMSESEALDKALDAFGLAKFDCYTCDVDTSRGYECYDFAIEADGATWLVTINGYNGFVEK